MIRIILMFKLITENAVVSLWWNYMVFIRRQRMSARQKSLSPDVYEKEDILRTLRQMDLLWKERWRKPNRMFRKSKRERERYETMGRYWPVVKMRMRMKSRRESRKNLWCHQGSKQHSVFQLRRGSQTKVIFVMRFRRSWALSQCSTLD